jgi:hypothetical protein
VGAARKGKESMLHGRQFRFASRDYTYLEPRTPKDTDTDKDKDRRAGRGSGLFTTCSKYRWKMEDTPVRKTW